MTGMVPPSFMLFSFFLFRIPSISKDLSGVGGIVSILEDPAGFFQDFFKSSRGEIR